MKAIYSAQAILFIEVFLLILLHGMAPWNAPFIWFRPGIQVIFYLFLTVPGIVLFGLFTRTLPSRQREINAAA